MIITQDPFFLQRRIDVKLKKYVVFNIQGCIIILCCFETKL